MSVQILRSKNPIYLKAVQGIEQEYRDEYLTDFIGQLLFYPDDTYLVVARTETTILGLIAAGTGEKKTTVWIYEAWVSKGTPRSITLKLFERIRNWAKEKGKTKIAGATRRKTFKAFRRWGFEQTATIYELNLGD